jgi:hypothetical protein
MQVSPLRCASVEMTDFWWGREGEAGPIVARCRVLLPEGAGII